MRNLLADSGLAGFVLSASVVFALATSINAQAPGARGLRSGEGSNTIQGRVYLPGGQSTTGSALKVRLETVSSAGGSSTVTDRDWGFRFNDLPPGSYTVVVDGGKEYETARESVTFGPEGSGRVTNVTIQLRLKANASNPAFANVPQPAIDFYQKGVAAAQKGNAKSAVDFLSKAVAAYPGFTLALNELGLQYLKLNQWDKAAETFEALLKLHAGDSAAELDLGIALFNQNKFDQAEAHLREALKLKSSGPNAHYYLGMVLLKTKRYDEAEKELQLTISNGGENIALAHKYLGGLYLSAHQNTEAADELEKYLRLDPKAADAERIKGTIKELRSKQ
jgi:Tfp pilus assembly protein PilF